MPDDAPPGKRKTPPTPQHAFATRMSHAGRAGTRVHGFVNPAIHRGSTVLLPGLRVAHRRARSAASTST